MNHYERMREPIGTPAIHSTIGGDLYISIASLEDGRAGLLLILTPLVPWIWFAVLLMAAGGVLALVPLPRIAGGVGATKPLVAAEAAR
jgi:cytochrome c biogenesis factor